MISNGTTERITDTIADVKSIHQKAQAILRAEKLLTAAEIEAKRQAAAPMNHRDAARLEAFLGGENVFAAATK